jgi:hypothetical protein
MAIQVRRPLLSFIAQTTGSLMAGQVEWEEAAVQATLRLVFAKYGTAR